MNPGTVQRLLAIGNLEKARRLGVGRRTDSLDLQEGFAAGERTMLLAIFDDAAGGQLVQPGHVPQERDARGVQVDTDEVDATGDDRIQRVLEVPRVDVVLVKPDADILRLDLDQFGQRVLEPATDGDAAAQGRI